MVDRNKVLETAQKLVAKGSYDKAIVQYQLLIADDPRDVRTLLKIGDLYTKTGAHDHAVDAYGRVASQYASQGFFLKAVAVYKQILKLDPASIDSQLKLANMYEQLDLVSDALMTYEHVAAHYARVGDLPRAIDTLGRMAELDSENIPVRIKYAEALSKMERTEAAAAEFEAGANLLREQGRMDDYIKVAERLLFHRPDVGVAREVAALYLERNDAKRALGKLQVCFQANPKDVATLELLARAFHLLGQHPKTISVYREIARIYQEGKKPAERERILRKILELDPNDQEAKSALEGKAPAPDASALFEVPPGTIMAPPRLPAASVPVPVPDDFDDEQELELLEDEFDDAEIIIEPDSESDESSEPAIFLEDTPPPAFIPEEPIIEVSAADPESMEAAYAEAPMQVEQPIEGYAGFVDPAIWPEIERLMSEVESFLRFGLLDKARTQLEQVVNQAPDYMLARQMLSDVYQQFGMMDDSIQQLLDMALICSQVRPDLSVMYLDVVLDLDPINIDARIMLGRVSVPVPSDEAVSLVGDQPLEPDPEERLSAVPNEPGLSEPQLAREADSELDGDLGEDESVLFMDEPTSEPVIHVSSAEPLGEFPDALTIPPPPMASTDTQASVLESVIHDVPTVQREALPEALELDEEVPEELEEGLEEAEFFVAQGLYDAALASLDDLAEDYPDSAMLRARIAEVRAAAARPADELEDESFALAEKLAEELEEVPPANTGSDILDVGQVFAQFKKGVEEQVEESDSETHFDLGIAYKEMGLIDDAIAEFEVAMRNPARACSCHTMVGLCRMEQGRTQDAINAFRAGLHSDEKNEREELALYFELANAYEVLGDSNEALYFFEKVRKRDAVFRAVSQRIRKIQAAMALAAEPSQEDDDELDAAFDDLLSDS